MRLSTRSRSSATTAAAGAMFVTLLVIGLLGVACGGSDGATTTTAAPGSSTSSSSEGAGGGEVRVIMTNIAYDPETVTIKVGDTVIWVNEDAPRHDVVADNGEFESDLFDQGETFSFTFTEAGTYPYHCSVHSGMKGTVTVQ